MSTVGAKVLQYEFKKYHLTDALASFFQAQRGNTLRKLEPPEI
jgi:hypothetical protein